MKNIINLFISLALLIGVAVYFFRPQVVNEERPQDVVSFAKPLEAGETETLIHALRQDFLASIDSILTHIKMLSYREHIYKIAGKAGPGEWQRLMQMAFGDKGDLILLNQAKWDEYQAWLSIQAVVLQNADPLTRQGMIWQKRTDLFADDAKIIWADEIAAYEEQRMNLQNTITQLNTQADISLEQRLVTLNNQFALAAESSQMPAEAYRSSLASVYFGLDTVQGELGKMDAEQRQATIHNLRKNMGYNEAQLKSMDAQDKEREERWAVGYQYMAAKEKLSSIYQGAELEQKIADLQREYFKREAKTISMEEADGFYRFERPRYYGRN
ncbi:MAG: hypothetical protein H7A09_00750 [Oceanospirillaceae bacterium]|nr:hypothetical protein [Oceanospirillaceae bacterium]MCP5335612.1 hypothetical protein [Oceanospirillaceae bacterium]